MTDQPPTDIWHTIVNYLWAGVLALVGWIWRDLHMRIEKLESGKADKAAIDERFDEITENQRSLFKMMGDNHSDNTQRMDRMLELMARRDRNAS